MSNLPSPNQPNRPTLWFLLPLVLGSLTTLIAIAEWAAQHVLQAVVAIICTVLIPLGYRVGGGVVQQLGDNWKKQIADRINSPHNNYQKRYRQWFINEHNKLDIGGVRTYDTPLPQLETVFVAL